MAMNTRCATWHTPIARPTWRRDDFCEGVMPIEPFVLIVADHDRRVFSVEGPMVADNPWSKPVVDAHDGGRSEDHTSELPSLMRISYAVFCLKKKKVHTTLAITITTIPTRCHSIPTACHQY